MGQDQLSTWPESPLSHLTERPLRPVVSNVTPRRGGFVQVIPDLRGIRLFVDSLAESIMRVAQRSTRENAIACPEKVKSQTKDFYDIVPARVETARSITT